MICFLLLTLQLGCAYVNGYVYELTQSQINKDLHVLIRGEPNERVRAEVETNDRPLQLQGVCLAASQSLGLHTAWG